MINALKNNSCCVILFSIASCDVEEQPSVPVPDQTCVPLDEPAVVTPPAGAAVQVPLEERGVDVQERETIRTFLREGCKCRSKGCHRLFDEETLRNMRGDCAELDRDQLDLLVMGHLIGSTVDSKETSGTRHLPKSREKPFSKFLYRGNQVHCIYMYVHYFHFSILACL